MPDAKDQTGWVPHITAQQMCAEMVAEDLAVARRHALSRHTDTAWRFRGRQGREASFCNRVLDVTRRDGGLNYGY